MEFLLWILSKIQLSFRYIFQCVHPGNKLRCTALGFEYIHLLRPWNYLNCPSPLCDWHKILKNLKIVFCQTVSPGLPTATSRGIKFQNFSHINKQNSTCGGSRPRACLTRLLVPSSHGFRTTFKKMLSDDFFLAAIAALYVTMSVGWSFGWSDGGMVGVNEFQS